jgi:hypothetical protein
MVSLTRGRCLIASAKSLRPFRDCCRRKARARSSCRPWSIFRACINCDRPHRASLWFPLRTNIVGRLTDRQALRIERRLTAEFHKFRTDQLWNTIDERFMDPRWLPERWYDPENVLCRLPRPLAGVGGTKSGGSAKKPPCCCPAPERHGKRKSAGVGRSVSKITRRPVAVLKTHCLWKS